MSTGGNQYYNAYAKKIIEAGREYVSKYSMAVILDNFFITPESDQGKTVLSALKANQLLLDKRYENSDLTVGQGYTPSCCVCNAKSYAPWKLIGVTIDLGCQVIKCLLPLVLCEKCFRKRFCFQVQTPFLCGIAVFPPVERNPNSPNDRPKEVIKAIQPLSISSTSSVSTAPAGMITQAQARAEAARFAPIMTPKEITSRDMNSYAAPVAYHQSMAVPVNVSTPALEQMNYGVDDVIGEARISDPASQGGVRDNASGGEIGEERCYTLPFRQGGFFRTWLNSFFVVNARAITMFPNDKRNEKKKKDILLYDATVSHSALSSDYKHPWCVCVQPGNCSSRQKAFILSLPTEDEEKDFLVVINRFIAIARQHKPIIEENYAIEDDDEE